MAYLLLFLEGIVTFISPCLLPLLPVYLSYFAANGGDQKKTLANALGFILGFTLVFVAMGAFAGTLGRAINSHSTLFNMVGGLIVIVFGLNFLGVLRIGFLNRAAGPKKPVRTLGFFPSLLFGMVFAISWTPCVGAFLGSALLLASLKGSLAQGIAMLLAFSLGLGLPFLTSALLINRLKGALAFIKRNYRVINWLSGGLLVLIGLLMATGYMGYWLSLLSF